MRGKRSAFERGVSVKAFFFDGRYVLQIYRLQGGAVRERALRNASDGFWQRNGHERLIAPERAF